MTPDWNAIRLDLLGIDEPMRANLREMRPFFAKVLPGILTRFYDKVRQYDPTSGIFKDGAMQEAIRLQLQHWDLIGAADFSLPYLSSVARFCEFNQRAGVAPQWYVGCRLMFVADQLVKAVETEVEIPRFGRAARPPRATSGRRSSAIAKANMLDTENVVAVYFGSNRQIRKNVIAEASKRFRAIIASLSTASSESKLPRVRSATMPATPRGLPPWSLMPRKMPPTTCSRWHRRPRSWRSRCARFGPGPGVQPHRRQRRDPGRQDQLAHQCAVAGRQSDRRRDQADHVGGRADQSPRAQRHHRGGARRRSRPRLRRGCTGVKALAAQTAKATDEIGIQIAGMQTATQEAVGRSR